MKNYLAFGAIGAVLAVATPASAQGLFPFFDAGPTTESTFRFRAEALRSDAYEIESSRIALQRSKDPAIRSYARGIIRDHKKTTDALLPEGYSLDAGGAVVSDKEGGPFSSPFGLITAPLSIPAGIIGRTLQGRSIIDNRPNEPGRRVALDERRQAQLAELSAVPSRRFGAAYTTQQVASHQEAVGLYQRYAAGGDSPQGRAFAGQALPHLEGHLDRASRLEARYGGGAEAF